MYFNNLFDKFDQRVLNHLMVSGVKEVTSLSSLNVNTYQHTQTAVVESAYLVRHDFFSFMKNVFFVTDQTFNSVNYILKSLGDLLENENNNLNLRNENSFHVCKKKASHDGDVIQFIHLKYDIGFEISPYGVKFYDMLNYIRTDYIPIIEDDLDTALNKALILFSQTIADTASISTEQFNDVFFNRLKSISFADIVSGKNISNDFIYPDRNMVYEKLKQANKISKSSSHQMNDIVMFSNKHAKLFLETVKPMFSPATYMDFLRAFNFYYNYKVVMHQNYILTLDFNYKHKLQAIADTSLICQFGNEFTLMFGPIANRQKNTQFMIYDKNKDFTRTNNILDIYDFIRKKCSPELTRIAQKPVDELVWGDIAVLMMDNI